MWMCGTVWDDQNVDASVLKSCGRVACSVSLRDFNVVRG